MLDKFASYDLAVMLKNKGFDGECIGFFTTVDNRVDFYLLKQNKNGVLRTCKNSEFTENVAAPLYQDIFDWLNTEKNIRIAHNSNRKELEELIKKYI